MGGSSGKIDKPWEDDPYRKLIYILKPSYGNRGKGRKTMSTDRYLNQHLWLNLNPLPWTGRMLPTNRVHATKLKDLVFNYFSEENEKTPTPIASIIYQIKRAFKSSSTGRMKCFIKQFSCRAESCLFA